MPDRTTDAVLDTFLNGSAVDRFLKAIPDPKLQAKVRLGHPGQVEWYIGLDPLDAAALAVGFTQLSGTLVLTPIVDGVRGKEVSVGEVGFKQIEKAFPHWTYYTNAGDKAKPPVEGERF